ncbi:hypothetical protein [Mesorhizobium sp. Cs1299R1N3]|uniref:hypothetical protein n=1 Tax=Mesorhizobium sp. Cs1299R1N3 TaxID=3015173 RepID=UPI00301C8B18
MNKPAIEFITRREAAKRADVAPQLIDYWTKKFPLLMKHHGEDGKVYVAVKVLDDIIAAKLALKAKAVAR